MGIITNINSDKIVLEISAQEYDGSSKTLLSALVRVYHIQDGSEVEDLTSTSMNTTSITGVYRYIWEPATLDAGSYIIEYTLTGIDSVTGIFLENLIVGYLEAKIDTITTDIDIIKEIETGRWRIYNNQLILYRSDNLTEVAKFDLFDSGGLPSSVEVFERKRAL